MNGLMVSLFGKFHVEAHGELVGGLEGRKVQELFGYLLINPTRSHSREALAELLWNERADGQSRKYLRQTLWQIQSALQPYLDNGSNILLVEPDWVQLNLGCSLWTDVAVFEQAYNQARNVAGVALDSAAAQSLHEAVHLYQGDLLEGCYEDWCIFERERLQMMYLAMLDKLIDCCEAYGYFEIGLAYAMQVLRYDRARERTHRRVMRLYYLSGNRTAALRQYEQMATILARELGVKPSRRSASLWEQIREDRVVSPSPPAATGQFPDADPRPGSPDVDPKGALQATLLRLRQVQSLLDRIQLEVRGDIQAIEQAIANP